MALKLALISFEFEHIKGLHYEPALDHDFSQEDPAPGEGIQPVVSKAFQRIKKCMTKSVSRSFHFGRIYIKNINNYLHIASTVSYYAVHHADNRQGQTHITLTAKFYRLDPSIRYKVTIDVEEMPSTLTSHKDPESFEYGCLNNEKIDNLVSELNRKFNLEKKIEYMPLVKRGRTDFPRFLVTSDERVLEYDFNQVLFHEQSQYQDVKIVHSPSLGNTLLLDNLQNLSEVDERYTFALMDRGYVSYEGKEILILGGGDGGLLYELLKENPKFVTMAEIDPVVIRACREFLKPCGQALENLEGTNYKIVIDDCMKVLRKSIQDGKRYDVVFNDLTDIPVCKREESLTAFESSAVQKENQWHFIEAIFNLSLDCLHDDGLYMTHTTGKGNLNSLKAFEEFLDHSKVQVHYERRSSYVPSFMEIWLFYTVTKQKRNDTESKRVGSK